MGKVPGLVLQGARYSYRRVVPAPLRPFIGSREIWLSLDTSDYREAASRARKAAVQADERLTKARQALTSGADPSQSREKRVLPDQELSNIAAAELWRSQVLAAKQPPIPNSLAVEEWTQELEEELGRYLMHDPAAWPDLFTSAKRLAIEHDPKVAAVVFDERSSASDTLQPVATQLSKLVELLRRVEIEKLKRAIDRAGGEHGDRGYDPLFAQINSFSPPPVRRDTRHFSLSDAIARFEADPTRSRLTCSAGKKYRMTFRVMREVIGDDRPLSTINRSDCAAVQELLAGLPANLDKLRGYRGCSCLREVAQRAAERQDRLLSPTTLRVYTHSLSAFFNWSLKKGLVTANPATRLAEARGPAAVSRRPFSIQEMNLLLAGLPAWSAANGTMSPGRMWVPRIAIFSGMRLGEIVTLKTNDITEIDGVVCFALKRTSDRRLKTLGAERVIPVHPVLCRLGLLEYAEDMRKHESERLFPDLPGDTQAKVSDLFQKRFSYWLKNTLGLHEDGLSFHSFRHGFRDALREGGVPIDATRALGGWARSGGIEERYGQGTRPSTLARWLASVQYDGLHI